jgi:glucose-1-phosphatase
MTKKRIVLFDIGRVLVDFDYFVVSQNLSKISASKVHSLTEKNNTIFEDYHLCKICDEQLHSFFIDNYGTSSNFEVFAEAICSSFKKIPEGLVQLSRVQSMEEVATGILSDNHNICTQWLKKNVPEIFKCDLVILSQEVGYLKPNPKIYQLTLEQLPPVDCLFIDDRLNNVEAALSLGIKAIHHKDWCESLEKLNEFLS